MNENHENDWLAPLVAMFVKNLPARAAALHSAEKLSNWVEIESLAHQMAGAAGGYGFPELGEVAAQIEALARIHPRPDDLARSIAAFDTLCTSLVRKAYDETHH